MNIHTDSPASSATRTTPFAKQSTEKVEVTQCPPQNQENQYCGETPTTQFLRAVSGRETTQQFAHWELQEEG